MRGRVMALYSVVFLGSTPIGAPLVGWLAEALGPRAGLVRGRGRRADRRRLGARGVRAPPRGAPRAAGSASSAGHGRPAGGRPGRRLSTALIFRQLIHDDLGCASYLVGDEHAGVAAVVDPKLEVDDYLRLARFMGVGSTTSSRPTTTPTTCPATAASPPRPARRSTSTALAGPTTSMSRSTTAGSSRSATCASRDAHARPPPRAHRVRAVDGAPRPRPPWAVLTGDTLFVGDLARPDLAVEPEDGARGIFRSLHERC